MRGNVWHSSYPGGDGGRAVGSGTVCLRGREGLEGGEGLVGFLGKATTFLIYGLGWRGIPLLCGTHAISICRDIPLGRGEGGI